MGIFWRKESNEMVEGYLEQKKQRKGKLSIGEILLFDKLIARMETNDSDADNYFHELIRKKKVTRTEELFDNGRREVLNYMLGDDYAEKYVKWLGKMPLYPYTRGYYRRPVRTEDPLYHYQKALDRLKDFFSIAASGLSIETILKGGRTEEERTFIGDIDYAGLLAVEIDNDNRAVIEQVKDILCSDNNHSGIVTYNLLQGIVMSQSRELYEMEGKLLLAAKLQEGLRQSIAETMDSGTIEGFTYLFRLIKDNNLQRFSAVKRAVGTWTGLVNETDADRISQKQIELIDRVLADPQYAAECLENIDAIEAYLGLWITGFHRMEDIEPIAGFLLQEGVKHKIQVLFYYLNATQSNRLQRTMAKKALELYRDDFSLVAAYLDSYLQGVNFHSYYTEKSNFDEYFTSQEEAEKQYELLKELQGKVKEKQTFSPFIFPWYDKELTRQEVVDKMAALVYISKNKKLIDDACLYFSQMSSYTRRNFIRSLLKKPSTPIQKETVTRALGDRAEYPRAEAFEVLDSIALDEAQYMLIEDLLRFKAGDLRQNAIKLLLKQKPCQLAQTIERLLADTITDKRIAALDMLLTVRANKEYGKVVESSLPLVEAIAKPSMKEQVLIDQLTGAQQDVATFNKANGYGLFDPKEEITLPALQPDADFDLKQAFSLFQEGSFFKKLLGNKPKADALGLFEKLNSLVETHTEKSNLRESMAISSCFKTTTSRSKKKKKNLTSSTVIRWPMYGGHFIKKRSETSANCCNSRLPVAPTGAKTVPPAAYTNGWMRNFCPISATSMVSTSQD